MLSATLLFVHPTLESLAGYILDDIVDIVSAEAPIPAADAASMSEDELTALLLRETARTDAWKRSPARTKRSKRPRKTRVPA